ncbi:T-cell ecto-ADP-ribosyltransferase 1 [Scomber scombrus]|uniref:NAD(P)(+)--arginine ADP-ribosyltransferase n=1 Tax=Scomber scombrus TaxID=13677 RepID=A0AAV1NHN6_SCOSC
MWYRRKTLVAVVIFTALCYKVTAVKWLTMAPEAVDDLYKGCNTKALEMVQSGLLRQELNSSEGFQSAWGSNKCSNLIPGRVQVHTDALLAYLDKGTKFRNVFNDAVETMGGNVSTYENYFQFKSLHFLLMDSMKLQKPEQCKEMYFMTDNRYEAKNGSNVRFGRFTKVNTDPSLHEEPEGTLFFFTTCFFVNVTSFCNDFDDTAVISPTEEFTVVAAIEHDGYNEIRLKHSKMTSYHNCYMFSRSPGDVSTKWLVLVLAVFSLYFFNC